MSVVEERKIKMNKEEEIIFKDLSKLNAEIITRLLKLRYPDIIFDFNEMLEKKSFYYVSIVYNSDILIDKFELTRICDFADGLLYMLLSIQNISNITEFSSIKDEERKKFDDLFFSFRVIK